MAQVALDKKMTFGYYKLPVVTDHGRYHSASSAPVLGVWCPRLNDRSSVLGCSSCPQFGGLVQDGELTHMFLRCRCGSAETDPGPGQSGVMRRARKLTPREGR